MMHPDQLYSVRQLQHQDMLAEAKQARVWQEFSGRRTTARLTWLTLWLRRVGRGRTRRAMSRGAVESQTAV
jgi:hypothetical protein